MESRRRRSIGNKSLLSYLEKEKKLDNVISRLGRVSPDSYGNFKVEPPFRRTRTLSNGSKTLFGNLDTKEHHFYRPRQGTGKLRDKFKRFFSSEEAPIDLEIKKALKEYGLDNVSYDKKTFETKKFNVFDKYFGENGEREQAFFIENVKKLYI
ncbi:unnamed protein product [Blepharisma stoltei]|uniref:Uncharacterized protein n=1 Tax=Blepharisma stoltei TaxID=1481888 RepID=A0AAU9IHP7_9CILI|nr:unnamed protein product [Blepharisma stoltei]